MAETEGKTCIDLGKVFPEADVWRVRENCEESPDNAGLRYYPNPMKYSDGEPGVRFIQVSDESRPAVCRGCHFDFTFKRSWIFDFSYDPKTGWIAGKRNGFHPAEAGERFARELGIWV